eukprot:85362-Alexandrium_andersonii.AAC.1
MQAGQRWQVGGGRGRSQPHNPSAARAKGAPEAQSTESPIAIEAPQANIATRSGPLMNTRQDKQCINVCTHLGT